MAAATDTRGADWPASPLRHIDRRPSAARSSPGSGAGARRLALDKSGRAPLDRRPV